MYGETQVDLATEYEVFVHNYRSVLESMAQRWLLEGASIFAVLHGSHALYSFPANTLPQMNSVIIPLPNLQWLFLSVDIQDTSIVRSRLGTDALLLAHLVTLESELDNMTQELITIQDQQLGLYELNRALDQCVELHTSLAVIARISQRLTNAHNVITALQIDERYVVEQTGSELSPHLLRIAFRTNEQEGRSLQPMLLDGGYMLCAPLEIQTGIPGVIVFLRSHEFMSPEIKLVHAIAEQGRTHLRNVMLHEEQIAQARLQTEVDLARRVQTRLLPRRLVPQTGVDIFGASRAANEVGGDFFDYIVKPGVAPLQVIGDVAGKGLHAAMVMTMTRTAMRSAICTEVQSPADLLRQVNVDLYDDLTELGLFTTAFVACYQTSDRVLTYANAGHSPVVYYKPGEGAYMLEADATPLGILPTCFCDNHSLTMSVGSILVAATDGFVEAENAEGVQFGYNRFISEIEAHAYLGAEALTEHLFSAVNAYRGAMPQSDDQTIVIIKRTDDEYV